MWHPLLLALAAKLASSGAVLKSSSVDTLNVCNNLPNGSMACVNPNWYTTCLDGVPHTPTQICSPGTLCCNNQCIPALGSTSCPNVCGRVADQKTTCIDSNTFSICLNQVPITVPQKCAPGTVCCSNACVFKSDIGCGLSTGYSVDYTVTSTAVIKTEKPANYCEGIADNNMVCKSTNTFNICIGGRLVSAPDQSCPVGTLCCAESNSCEVPSKCQTLLPSKCSGVPDGQIICSSGSTFDTCSGGVVAGAKSQKCASGTVCCADGINRCDFKSSCGSVLGIPLSLISSVIPTLNPPANACAAVPDNVHACVNPSQFIKCLGGRSASEAQSCTLGTKCCAGKCVQPNSPTCNTCSGVQDNSIACTSKNSFVVCSNQNPLTPPQYCATGTICCGNACVPASDTACGGIQTPISKIKEFAQPKLIMKSVAPTPFDAYCTGIPNNDIVCVSKTTFVYCSGNVAASLETSCPLESLCCSSTNSCARQCPLNQPSLPSKCNGFENLAILCTSKTTYNQCVNGEILRTAAKTCSAGTVCDSSTNTCAYRREAGSYMGPQLQQILTATVDKVDGSTSICAGVENRRSVCVNPSQYSVCMNGVPTSNPTSCDDGTTCVNGFCVALDHPSANVCYSALDNNIACTSERSYVSCLNQDVISSPIKCPQGTKCCGNACRDESSPACGALPSQPPQPSTTPIPSTPQLDCRKIKDNNIICRSADNFNYCLSNSLTSTLLDTSCPFGTYCCGETNSCQPSCQVTLPSRCAAVPDGSQLCVSDTEFNLCSGGAFALARPQKCSPGTECCADSNVCNFKAACGKQLPKSLLPYSQVQASVTFGTPINVCAQVPESQMACLNPTFYTTCQNGYPSNIIAQCPAGKKCCNNACLSPENAQCNVCAVAVDYAVACTSEDSFTICLDNQLSTVPEKCPNGFKCCGNACVAPGTANCGI